MICPKCHSPALPGSVFCPSCGAKLAENAEPCPTDLAQIRIGRAEDNEICLTDSQVSRLHAALFRQQDGSWRLVDLSSKNGTFVNGRRVSSAILSQGDEIVMGNVRTNLAELLAKSGRHATYSPDEPTQVQIPHNFDDVAAPTNPTLPKEIKTVIFLNILLWILSIFYTLLTYDQAYSYSPLSIEIGRDIGSMCINMFFFYKLYKLRNWARLWIIIGSSIGIGFIVVFSVILFSNILLVGLCIIGIIDGSLNIYYLTRPNVVAAFKKKRAL